MSPRQAKLLILGLVLSAAILVVVGFLGLDSLFLEPNWISVRTVKINNPALAQALQGIRLVQISDLHLGNSLGFRENELVRRLNSISPDIILVSGDILEGTGSLAAAEEFFSRLHPQLWTYGVLGNSDRSAFLGENGRDRLRRARMSLIGGKALRMQVGEGNSCFYLAGVDFPGYGAQLPPNELTRILRGVPPEVPVILLSYSPETIQAAAAAGVDLVLSGDSHGGQVGLPGMEGLFVELGRSPYVRGRYRVNDAQLYVNRGIATKGLPARFLCPPEITLFEFSEEEG